MVSEAQKRATKKWQKNNTTNITLRFNNEKDREILNRLDEKGKTAYIRELIKKDIESGQ